MTIILSNFEQYSLEEMREAHGVEFDLMIVNFARDMRSRFVLGQIANLAKSVIAISSEQEELEEGKARQFERRYQAHVMSLNRATKSLLEYAQNAKKEGKDLIRVLIDVSAMPRLHMGEIFSQLKEVAHHIDIQLSVAYCLAKYVTPPEVEFPLIRRVAPVNPTFAGWGSPASLPVDAVVSLGYENGKAIGAVEYLEPRARWVFVPNSPEVRFLKQVKKHNDLLIESTPETVIDYEVLKPVDTYFQLLSLVMGLVQESRPVLLPFGPKIFFAISLLVAMRVEKVSVWHVDGEGEQADAAPVPSQHSAVLNCLLSTKEISTAES